MRIFKNLWFTRFAQKEAISDMENISQRETRDYKKLAMKYFMFTQKEIEFAVETGKLVEIGGVKNEKEIPE